MDVNGARRTAQGAPSTETGARSKGLNSHTKIIDIVHYALNNNKRVDGLVRKHAREVADLRMSLDYTQKEIDEMKTTIRSQGVLLTNTSTRDVERVTCAQRELEDGIEYVENHTSRNNLRIDGVAKVAAETWADTDAVVRKTFAAALKLPEDQAIAIRTERSHRTGESNSLGRPKTAVVMFESCKGRDAIS